MQIDQEEKNLERERLVFFCDAVIAIAITLLSFNLKVQPAGPHFTFLDLAKAWHTFAAFLLSFIIIAAFWVNHHRFFVYIKAVDPQIITYNICWLLFIVLLPFTSSLISVDFFNKPAMFIYCMNVLLVTYFQNSIWDYATQHKELAKDNLTTTIEREYRVGCNLALVNAIIAVAVAFLSPLFAFISLLGRIFMFRQSAQKYVAHLTQRRKKKREKMIDRRKEAQ
jgi:uncharacterized membrane protein